MMDYTQLHEVEIIGLRSPASRRCADLLPVLRSIGFTQYDDVLSFDRTGDVPPWQPSSLVDVEVLSGGEEVFGFDEGVWDTLQLKYLFAFIPFAHASQFLDVVASTSDRLGLKPRFRGHEITLDALKTEFEKMREDLLLETGEEPGSESLAILIHSTYPRR